MEHVQGTTITMKQLWKKITKWFEYFFFFFLLYAYTGISLMGFGALWHTRK